MSAFTFITSQINFVIPITCHKLWKLCLQWSCNAYNDSSFLAIYCLLGCNHCTIFDKHEQNLHTYVLGILESHMQWSNLHIKYKSSKVIYSSRMYSNISEQIQDTFLNIKFVNTVYIYDLPSRSSTFFVLFFNECKCAWKNAFFICLAIKLHWQFCSHYMQNLITGLQWRHQKF